MKTYLLKPSMTLQTVVSNPCVDKPATLPPRQPLPVPVVDSNKPRLKLGLDVHLDFSMGVAQQAHSNPKAPRKFTREELVAQVQQWITQLSIMKTNLLTLTHTSTI